MHNILLALTTVASAQSVSTELLTGIYHAYRHEGLIRSQCCYQCVKSATKESYLDIYNNGLQGLTKIILIKTIKGPA